MSTSQEIAIVVGSTGAMGRVITPGAAATIENDEGVVTSVAYSPSLSHWIGLAFLKHGPQRIGQRVRAYDALRGEDFECEVCSPVFIDPEVNSLRGERKRE